MNIVLSVTFTGTPDAEDVLAARHAIFVENKLRAQRSAILGATPETPLPTSTPAEIKASYLSILTGRATTRHASYILEAKSEPAAKERFTPAELQQILANLVTRLNNGETAASIITDTAT